MTTTKTTTLGKQLELRTKAAEIDPNTRFFPNYVLADWLDERGMEGNEFRKPVKKYIFTCEGMFHGANATVRADVVKESGERVTIVVSRRQIARASKKLCGMSDCGCRDGFYVPGDIYDEWIDDDDEGDVEFTVDK